MNGAALVTGGSSGIGLAIARMLGEEGFALTLASRTQAKVEAAAEELGAHAVAADVSNEENCRRLVQEHAAHWGRLDVLVNSAGVGIFGRIDELPTKQVDLQLDVNLRGLMLVTPRRCRSCGSQAVSSSTSRRSRPSPPRPFCRFTAPQRPGCSRSRGHSTARKPTTACAPPPSAPASSTHRWRARRRSTLPR